MKAARILAVLLSMGLLNIAFGHDDRMTTAGGEVILGTYVKTVDGVIHFQSDAFGLIKVEAAKAKLSRGSEEAAVNHVAAQPVPQVASTPPAPPAPPEGALRRLLNLPETFQAKFSVGLSILDGASDNKTLTTAFNFSNQSEKAIVTGHVNYDRGEVGGVVYRDDFTVGINYLHFLKKGGPWYALAGTHYETDPVHLVDYDFDLLAGLGRNLIENKKMVLRVSGIVNGEWEDLGRGSPQLGTDPGRTYTTKFGFDNTFGMMLTPTIQFEETLSYLVNPDDSKDDDLKLKLQLSAALTKFLSLELIYTYDYDGTSAVGVPKDQSLITSQISYKF